MLQEAPTKPKEPTRKTSGQDLRDSEVSVPGACAGQSLQEKSDEQQTIAGIEGCGSFAFGLLPSSLRVQDSGQTCNRDGGVCRKSWQDPHGMLSSYICWAAVVLFAKQTSYLARNAI